MLLEKHFFQSGLICVFNYLFEICLLLLLKQQNFTIPLKLLLLNDFDDASRVDNKKYLDASPIETIHRHS